MSVGLATFISNILYLAIQYVISRKLDWKNYVIQLIVVALLSVFIDFVMLLAQFLPVGDTIVLKFTYLILSLFIIAGALFLLLNTKLPLMPYDSLVPLIVKQYNLPLGKTRVTCDILNVAVAAVCCLIFLHSLGSVGIGTIISALCIGRILGFLMKKYGTTFSTWLFK